MIEQLFGSKTRVKLLQLFYSNPNRSFYVREITRKIDEQINSVRRELANLQSIGIISSDTNNNRLYYEVNQKYEFHQPLEAIFGKGVIMEKNGDAGAPKTDAEKIKALGHVELAIYTGQFTRDERASVDVLIVGDVNQAKLNKFIEELEAKEGKEIRFASMPLDEYKYREQVNDRFLGMIMSAKKQILVDQGSAPAETEKAEEPEETEEK